MAYIKNILEKKGSQVWTVAPTATVREALRLMADKAIGALLVVDGDKIAGVFSERDYARRTASSGNMSLEQPVSALMSHPVYYIQPEQTTEECMRLMTAKHIRHLPVIEGGKLAGMISIGDVVKSLIQEKEMTIQGLEHYISGRQVM